MEDTDIVDQSTPPAPEPAAPAPAPEVPPDPEALAVLAEQAARQRLPVAEEERAVQLVCAGLLAGKDDLTSVTTLLPQLGWAIATKGVSAAWPALKSTAKSALLKTLLADESEAGRRIRLSLARGLFKVPDVAASTKLILSVCKEIRDKQTGELSARDAQNFANVMIGKGKPWLAQIALAELKPADAALLVHCAIIATFAVNGPPVTPLGVLKWAADAGQLTDLHEAALAVASKGVARWSPKWAEALRTEVPGTPEPILAALKSAEAEPPPAAKAAPAHDDDDDDDDDDGLPNELKEDAAPVEGEAPRTDRPVYVSKTVQPREQRQPQAREPKGPQARSPQFNPSDALRQVEAHIAWLKSELQNADRKLRDRPPTERRDTRRKPDVIVIEGEPTPEELARLNVQLEARIAELQARVDDLGADAEARAVSAGAFAAQPETNPDTQLRTLLGLKLGESFADFEALETEDRDLVVPQHYRTVLREVFDVLKAEGVPLAAPPVS